MGKGIELPKKMWRDIAAMLQKARWVNDDSWKSLRRRAALWMLTV